jgi:signal transduction histidine kinase
MNAPMSPDASPPKQAFSLENTLPGLVPEQRDPPGTISSKKRFDWGSSTAYQADLRNRELLARAMWFIHMRWFAVIACLFGGLVGLTDFLPIRLRPITFFLVAGVLIVTNTAYTLSVKRMSLDLVQSRKFRTLLRVQIFFDYAALTALNYGMGSVESPILMVYIPHIILSTLFFNRLRSLMVVVGAWLFAILPIFLECRNWVPRLTIFSKPFKDIIYADCGNSLLLFAGLGATFFLIWYLFSEIATSLKLREHQLEQAYDMLMHMDHEKTQATLRATHELKAPFAAIKSYVYTLRDGYCGELPEAAAKVVERIGQRCDRLTSKISDIIHLSNLKTLLITDVDLKPVELTPLVLGECQEANLMGKSRGVQVNCTLAGRYTIQGSSAHLKTMFSNLIINAVNYSHPGQTVEVALFAENDQIFFRVQDRGIGIPDENLSKIFEEHFRCNNAVAHNPNGTGLGMPMVKEIVRLHGAHCLIHSEVGQGTTIEIHFKKPALKTGKEENP